MVVPVYLEIGAKRVFACALDWPGWCRSGRDERSALQALVDYARRYAKAVRDFKAPRSASELRVVEELKGNATTDFGAPGVVASMDSRPLRGPDFERQLSALRSCWSSFDKTAKKHVSATLRKGPRGGGRDLERIVAHVLEADRAYISGIGGARKAGVTMDAMRATFLETLRARASGEPAPPSSRRKKPLWPPRYAIRRSAWHALDHAWEIEDRAEP